MKIITTCTFILDAFMFSSVSTNTAFAMYHHGKITRFSHITDLYSSSVGT